MKAIVVSKYGEPDVLELKEIEEGSPGEHEVKVKLYAAGVNPAEVYITTGNYNFYKPNLPFTPGFDGAGIVEEIGSKVSHVKEGDRVYIAGLLAKKNTGSYAQKIIIDSEVVHPLPDHVSFEEGASIGVPALAAFRALFQRANLKAGEVVLIHGASGGVGVLAVQMASAIGAKVIGTASTEEGRKLITDLGAEHALNHINQDNLQELLNLTDGKGPDVIIEMLANVNLQIDLEMINQYGRIVIVGNRGSLDFNPRMIMAKEADIKGMAIWNFRPEEYQEALSAIHGFLKSKLIKPIVGELIPLAEASRAQAEIIDSKSLGKMILKIRE